MTNEEEELLIAYLVDAGEIDGESPDIEDQFLDWYQAREQMVSGETYYKAFWRPPGLGSVPSGVATGSQVPSDGWKETRIPEARPTYWPSDRSRGVATTGLPAVAMPKATLPACPMLVTTGRVTPLEVIARLRDVLDRFEEGSE